MWVWSISSIRNPSRCWRSSAKDRLRFPDSPDADKVAYYFESLDFPVPNRELNSYLADFEPGEAEHTRLHQHPGIEFLYVLSGQLELRTAEDKHELAEGDAIYFDSTVPMATADRPKSLTHPNLKALRRRRATLGRIPMSISIATMRKIKPGLVL